MDHIGPGWLLLVFLLPTGGGWGGVGGKGKGVVLWSLRKNRMPEAGDWVSIKEK